MRNHKGFIGILITSLFLTGLIGWIVLFKDKQTTTAPQAQNPNAIILKVGRENIYQKDLDYELAQLPKSERLIPETRQAMINKLIEDSIILQLGDKEEIINLDKFSYDSSTKDYMLRIKEVENVKKSVNEKTERLEGLLVSIWFYNSILPKMGIEKAQEVVRGKITPLFNAVKVKQMTPQQAMKEIQNDVSLKEIDGAYIANAGYEFNRVFGQKITIDKTFDDTLWKLNEGEVSELKALRGTYANPDEKNEVLYAFAVINRRTRSGIQRDFKMWLEEGKKNYQIVQY